MKTFKDVIFEGEAIDFHKEKLQNAKQRLIDIQGKISELQEEEKEAKIDFLKSLELSEEYMDAEGDKFLFVGFQIKPEPVALVEWPGGMDTMHLDYIKENFLSFNEFCEKEDREARSFMVSPCQKCGTMIPSEMQICSKCEEGFYPCPICKKDIPATEPFCRDCMNDIKSKAA